MLNTVQFGLQKANVVSKAPVAQNQSLNSNKLAFRGGLEQDELQINSSLVAMSAKLAQDVPEINDARKASLDNPLEAASIYIQTLPEAQQKLSRKPAELSLYFSEVTGALLDAIKGSTNLLQQTVNASASMAEKAAAQKEPNAELVADTAQKVADRVNDLSVLGQNAMQELSQQSVQKYVGQKAWMKEQAEMIETSSVVNSAEQQQRLMAEMDKKEAKRGKFGFDIGGTSNPVEIGASAKFNTKNITGLSVSDPEGKPVNAFKSINITA